MMGALLFVLVVYGSTWALNLALRADAAAGSLQAVYMFLFGTVWTPTVTALILALVFGGRRSCAELLRRLFRAPRSAGWFVAAALVPSGAVCLAVMAARAFGSSAARPDLGAWPSIIGMQIITGAVGEELGWRGFLLPTLARHAGIVVGAVISGLLWSGWHIAGAFFPGLGPQAAPLIPFLSFVAVFGVFLALVFAFTGQVLAPMLAHLSLNVTLAVAGIPIGSRTFWWVLVLSTGTVLATMWFVQQPAHFALEPSAPMRS